MQEITRFFLWDASMMSFKPVSVKRVYFEEIDWKIVAEIDMPGILIIDYHTGWKREHKHQPEIQQDIIQDPFSYWLIILLAFLGGFLFFFNMKDDWTDSPDEQYKTGQLYQDSR